MSAKSEFTRDKDGFLKCKDCPRRFLTEISFENHSSNQHKKETKPVICHINTVHKKLTPYQCLDCKKSFWRKSNLAKHTNTVHKKLTPLQCKSCNVSYGMKSHLTMHTNTFHKNL